MASYNYVNTTGALKNITADNLDSAKSIAKDRAADSGFQLVNTPATTPSAITMEQMTKPTQMQTPQAPTDTTNYGNTTKSATETIAANLEALTKARDEARTKQTTDATDILKSMQYIADNKTKDTRQAEIDAGVDKETENFNKYVQQLTELNAQGTSLNREAQAIPIQDQANSAGQGITDAGLAPITTAKLRDNALKALSIAQQSDIASAAATGSLAKLNSAKDKAQQIIDLKYKPLEDTLAIRQKQYDLNKDALATIDADRTEALGVRLEQEKQKLADAKAAEKEKADIITNAAPFAPADLLAKANAAPDAKTAAIILGKYSKDYLQNILLNEQIKSVKANTIKTQAETNKIYNDQKAVSKEALKTAEENKLKVQSLTTKIGNIKTLTADPYLSTAVGPNSLSRTSFSSFLTGGKQNFISGVEQLTNQSTLDELLELKKAGGTLGALNESEGAMLRDSATKINNWKIVENGKVVGYNIDETNFKKELDEIQRLSQQAVVNAGGSPDLMNPISSAASDYLDKIALPSINTANANSSNPISSYAAGFTRTP